MTSCYVVYRVVGDTGPDLFTTLEGTDLSTLTALSVNVRRPDGGEITRPAVIDDAAAGQFHIAWSAGDLVQGDSQVEYIVVDASGNIRRLPTEQSLIIRVRGQV